MNEGNNVVNNIFFSISSRIRIWLPVLASFIIVLIPQQLYAAQGDKIAVSVTIVAKPCKINDGRVISIDFGDVMTTRVDVSSVVVPYKKIPINYTLTECSGSANLKMAISGDASSFDGKLLKTNNDGLAIKIMKEDGQIFPINTSLDFTYPNAPKFFAAPVKNQGVKLTGKMFAASATITVAYQ